MDINKKTKFFNSSSQCLHLHNKVNLDLGIVESPGVCMPSIPSWVEHVSRRCDCVLVTKDGAISSLQGFS